MADYTSTRVGQVNSAGDPLALFLKVFGGEILTAFYAKQVTLGRHIVRTIANGKTAQFPVAGTGAAHYHTVGTALVGQAFKHNERTISIDDKLVSDYFVPDIDEAMNHYSYRSIYSTAMGDALASGWDRNILQLGVLAARASSTITGGNGGSVVVSANSKTDATSLRNAIAAAAQKFAEKEVPLDEAYVYLRPAQYYMLIDDPKLTNADYAQGNGGVAEGKIMRCMGLPLVMTNHLPITDLSAVTPTKYAVNAANTAALVMQKGAVGTVKLMDLRVQEETTVRYQGTLMVASYAIGSDILRPECAVEIATA